MNFEEHCRDTREQFEVMGSEVHKWLDEFLDKYPWPDRYKHRKHRHHEEGVEKAREIYGNLGAMIAERHVRMDNDGWLPSKKDYDIIEYEG
ncbi:DUF6915 family protein [candidate division KSB1 bacterium]